MLPLDHWLSYSLPDNAFIDIARFAVACAAFLLFLLQLRIILGKDRPEARYGKGEARTVKIGVISYSIMLLPLALTELQQMTRPFLPWRLPLVAFGIALGYIYSLRRV